jgi:hypothetical protein
VRERALLLFEREALEEFCRIDSATTMRRKIKMKRG